MALDSIPQDLAALQQFCLRVGKQPYIKDSQHKNSFTSTGWPLNSKDWLSFSEALEATQKPAKVFHDGTMQPVTGIGFLVARSTQGTRRPLGGDLDCCRDPETGYISQWARAFLQKVKPFYAEVSPSRCGVRFFDWGHLPGGVGSIFGNGPDDLPEDTRERILEIKPTAREKLAKGDLAFNGLEFYESGRHLTITGDRLEEFCYPSEDQTKAIGAALEPFVVAEAINTVAEGAKASSGGKLPELDILAVIDTSGFTESGGQLFGSHPTEGSTTGRNLVVNPGQNVYCWMHDGINAGGDAWTWLACESGAVAWEQAGPGVLKDASVMRKTLEHAVKRGLVPEDVLGVPAAMSPAEALLLAEDLRKKVNTDPGAPFEEKYTQALAVLQSTNAAEYQRLMADLKGRTSIRDLKKAIKQTSASMGAATRRAKAEASGLKLEDICNVDYDEKGDISSVTLAPTRAAAAIEECLTLVMSEDSDEEIYYFDNGIYHPGGERIIDIALCNVAADAVNIKMLREVLRRVKNDLLSEPVSFDYNPYLLGVKNGVVDLLTGEFRDYLPEDLITDQIPVTYDPEAKCPASLDFLGSITPNTSDRITLIDWFVATAIKEALAYVLFLLGLGRNGKGIYEKLIKKFFGQSAFRDMPLAEVSRNNFAASGFYKKRGWIASETGKRKAAIGTDFMKLTSGNGVIDGDRKNQSRIQFEPYFQTIVDTNTMPQIEDNSIGWMERFVKVDLPYVFVANPDKTNPLEKQRDPALFEKLSTPGELSGILNLLLFRSQAIGKNKTIHKRPGTEMFAEYAEQSSSVKAFLDAFCEYDGALSGLKQPSEPIYEAYKEWCGYKVGEVVDKAYFGKQLKKFCGGVEPKRGKDKDRKSITTYQGLNYDSSKCKAALEALRLSMSQGVSGMSQGNLKEGEDTQGQQITMSQVSQGKLWNEIIERFGNPQKEDKSSPEREKANLPETLETLETSTASGGVNEKLPCDILETLPETKSGIGPHPRRDEPTPTKQRVKFRTDYETDLDGELRQVHPGDVVEVSSERAAAWIRRGVAEAS